MRILAIQFASSVTGRPVPRFDAHLGTLLALLGSRGHEIALLGLARFDIPLIKAAMARSLPQLIYADISGVCVDLARRTFEHIRQHESLSIVAGGVYPTVDPAGSLSLPGVQAVAIGEPDASLVTYLERMKDPAIAQVVLGVWLRDERGVALPKMPSLVEDLDSLPHPERDLFGYAAHVQRTNEIEIATGRGCPQRCAYCVNEHFRSRYSDDDEWVRHRSPDDILDEIDQLRARCQPVRLVRFLDHAFALDTEWLDAFLDRYVFRCALPFRCHLRLNRATEDIIGMLDSAGCHLVDVELISGSDFIRNEIFHMDLSAEQIEAAFARLHRTNIRTRAIVYLGAPYESEASLADTRTLLRHLKPTVVDARPYYPFPGTLAAETCSENGWVHARGVDQYHSDRNGIDMPACRPDLVAAQIRRLRAEFPGALDEPWWRRWSQASRVALGQLFDKRRA